MELKIESAVSHEALKVAAITDTTALELVTGRLRNGDLVYKRLVGHAYLPAGSDLYELKLMMLPRHTYFMKRNRDCIHRYTVYSKRFLENDQTRLLNPVGFGRMAEKITTYIEIYFPLLGRLVFLDMIPKN